MRQLIVFFCLLFSNSLVYCESLQRIRLATTTSIENSGLLAILNPSFEQQYSVKVDVIAAGTGKAIRLGKNGDVDLILVHAPAAELEFINDGSGIEREPVMHNDFIIVGPAADPARLKSAKNLQEAIFRLVNSQAIFVSRGDDSGTHKKEQYLWKTYNHNQRPSGNWYLSVGQGMGAVLQIANDKQGYTLTDRGTYLAYQDKIKLEVVFENDEALFNPYHVILVNPAKHPHTKVDLTRQYSAFIRSEIGQRLIRDFTVNDKRLFHPDVIQ